MTTRKKTRKTKTPPTLTNDSHRLRAAQRRRESANAAALFLPRCGVGRAKGKELWESRRRRRHARRKRKKKRKKKRMFHRLRKAMEEEEGDDDEEADATASKLFRTVHVKLLTVTFEEPIRVANLKRTQEGRLTLLGPLAAMETDEADSEDCDNNDDVDNYGYPTLAVGSPSTTSGSDDSAWSDRNSDGTPYVSKKKKKALAKVAKQQRLANGAATEPPASTSDSHPAKPASDSRDGKASSKADCVDDSKPESAGNANPRADGPSGTSKPQSLAPVTPVSPATQAPVPSPTRSPTRATGAAKSRGRRPLDFVNAVIATNTGPTANVPRSSTTSAFTSRGKESIHIEQDVDTEMAQDQDGGAEGQDDNDDDNRSTGDVDLDDDVDVEGEENENEKENGDDDMEHDNEMESDLHPTHCAETLDVLATIEYKWTTLRERIYLEKTDNLAWEEDLVKQQYHPEMLHLLAESTKRRDKRLELANKKRFYEIAGIGKRRRPEDRATWSGGRCFERDHLQTDMISETNRKRRKLEREHRAAEPPQPSAYLSIVVQELQLTSEKFAASLCHRHLFPPAPSLRKIITTLPFSNGYSKQKLEYPFQSSDLVYPELTVLSSADVSQDLELLLQIRRHSSYDSRHHRSSMMNAASPSSQPAGFEPPTHYDPYGRPTQHHSVSGPIPSGKYPYLPGPPPGTIRQAPVALLRATRITMFGYHPTTLSNVAGWIEKESVSSSSLGLRRVAHTNLTNLTTLISVREGMEDRPVFLRCESLARAGSHGRQAIPVKSRTFERRGCYEAPPRGPPAASWYMARPRDGLIGQNEEDILLIDYKREAGAEEVDTGAWATSKRERVRELQREKDWIMQERERQEKIRAREREREKCDREKEMDREREKEQMDIDQLERSTGHHHHRRPPPMYHHHIVHHHHSQSSSSHPPPPSDHSSYVRIVNPNAGPSRGAKPI
ncbi:hypothetical protein D9611_008066 [Ephemerocybe angulata]|uniref:Uncharacterized protein n=1 Tax=Ephemerocybe angulata TaxID=980116 RepID=A0A8H5BZN7_9AGAR|nr:hypothetical protein D9611_008066 [Tulosesus angulatus]